MARDDIADYGAYLAEERHASQNTVSSYLRDVTQFSEYLADRHGASLRQADADTVQEYMGWMRGRGTEISWPPSGEPLRKSRLDITSPGRRLRETRAGT